MASPEEPKDDVEEVFAALEKEDEFKTLKYHLLGPSLTKAGQDKVDQSKVRQRLKKGLSQSG
jgi:DNA polymerase kappa